MMTSRQKSLAAALATVSIIIAAALLLLLMGRTPWYKYGPPELWSGDVLSDQNSQQFADPYTLTHIIHGVGFYALLWLLARRLPLGAKTIIAVFLESAWEVFENTDLVINRYRESTISLDYYGDSVLNSVGDIITALAGFLLTARLPVYVTVIGVLAIEVALAFLIRDNLSLNILMLLYPFEAIRIWQSGG